MKRPRTIVRLDVKGATVVKGVAMDGLRVVGNAHEMATRYYEQGAPELLIVDVVASLYAREPGLAALIACTQDVFVPVTYCGGVRCIEQARDVLRSGADVVGVNTAALARPELLDELCAEFGGSTIALQLDAKRCGDKWRAYADGGRTDSGYDAIEWARESVARGVGQVLCTSVDRDGTCGGPDLALADALRAWLPVPLVFGGGIASAQHVARTLRYVDGVTVGAALHYDKISIDTLKGQAWNQTPDTTSAPGYSSERVGQTST